MSPLGVVLIAILLLVLFGGLGGPRFGAPWQYGYGFGNSGVGLVTVLLIVVVVLLLTGRLG